ncbi:MAG: DUF4255 domain-containing protein, partial [Hymenobacter sp.]|nr:DUF4255 domain-containing protein [Hymenobacter sp.]
PTARNLLPDRGGSGAYQYANPALTLNLRVLFAANFGDYAESLKLLGSTLAFFQGRALFTPQNAPLLDPAFDRLTVELETTSYQDWGHLWAMLGAKHRPGVIYKVKTIPIQDGLGVTGKEPPAPVLTR